MSYVRYQDSCSLIGVGKHPDFNTDTLLFIIDLWEMPILVLEHASFSIIENNIPKSLLRHFSSSLEYGGYTILGIVDKIRLPASDLKIMPNLGTETHVFISILKNRLIVALKYAI